jgi:phage tail-like protein
MPSLASRLDPVVNFSFSVEIDGLAVGWFTECSSITLERQATSQRAGGANDYVYQLPGPVKWNNVTLKRGLAGPELWNWFQTGRYDGQVKPRSVSIVLYNVDRTVAHRWELLNAFPAKWSISTFNTDRSEAVIETLELTCGTSDAGQTSLQRHFDPSNPIQRSETEIDQAQESEINLSVLADKVYNLLKQELRVERDRLGGRHF